MALFNNRLKAMEESGQSLYIHYPYCKHLCNYCDFYKLPLSSQASYQAIESSLQKNFEDYSYLAESRQINLEKPFETVYLGGGTPSLWDVEGAAFLSKFFKKNNIALAKNCEFTMEVDPGAWTTGGLAAWKKLGVNRFSLGIQAFDEKYLKIMDRSHDLSEVEKTLGHFCRQKENFSADLMLGLPFSKENKRDVIEELKKILFYQPSHLSVYILKTRKNYPHRAFLPDDEQVSEEYLRVSEFLKSQGFTHYEVSNFALPGRESKHNLKYWEATTVSALGPNSTGFLKAGKKAVRYQHKPSNKGLAIETLDENALRLEEVYLGLRTNQGLALAKYFGKENSRIANLAAKWSALGFVESFDSERLVLTNRGFLMIDSIMDDFFLYELI